MARRRSAKGSPSSAVAVTGFPEAERGNARTQERCREHPSSLQGGLGRTCVCSGLALRAAEPDPAPLQRRAHRPTCLRAATHQAGPQASLETR